MWKICEFVLGKMNKFEIVFFVQTLHCTRKTCGLCNAVLWYIQCCGMIISYVRWHVKMSRKISFSLLQNAVLFSFRCAESCDNVVNVSVGSCGRGFTGQVEEEGQCTRSASVLPQPHGKGDVAGLCRERASSLRQSL